VEKCYNVPEAVLQILKEDKPNLLWKNPDCIFRNYVRVEGYIYKVAL